MSTVWWTVLILISITNNNGQTTTDPTVEPTRIPTISPITCNYLPFNNIPINASDITLNITDLINYVELGTNPKITSSSATAAFLGDPFLCNNTNEGCLYEFLSTATFYEGTLHCDSFIGCNIECYGNLACGNAKIYAQRDANLNATLKTAINIVCYEDACVDMNVYIRDITSAHIHCVETGACKRMQVIFEDISSKNNINTSINCYARDACTDINIVTDGILTQLNMYEYSSGVILNNGIGYLPPNTITCDTDNRYIQYPFDKGHYIENLVRNKYPALPCDDITVLCIDGTGENGTCRMQYEYLLDTEKIEKLQDKSTGNYSCVNLALKDIISAACIGTCLSPTKAPIAAPSNAPTQPPTISPSGSPSYSPSSSPTVPPSLSPTFSPSTSPITPTLNPTAAPTVAPSYSPTAAPTYSPTESPTRYPTTRYEYDRFNTKMNIVYILKNLTMENCKFILDYSGNNAIEYMQEIVESSYLDETLLPTFSLFTVKINKINQIDFRHNKDALSLELVCNKIDGKIGSIVMFLRSEILFANEYLQYFRAMSDYYKFWNNTSSSFQRYFKNPNLTFSVANSSDLSSSVYKFEEYDYDYTFWIITGILFLCVITILCGSMCNKIYKKQFCLPFNGANWMSLIFLFLCIWDVMTNINLAATDNPYSSIIYIFIMLRVGINLYYATSMQSSVNKYNVEATNWFERNKYIFILLVILSGGNYYPMLYVISSNIFGIGFTNSGLSLLELRRFYYKNNKILLMALLFECLPHLIIQIIFMSFFPIISEELSQSTLLAFCSTSLFSIFYIIFLIINYIELKTGQNKVNIIYYIQVSGQESFKSKQRKHINNRKGLKYTLKQEFIKLYPNIDIKNNLEIGNVTIRKKSFIIRFIHQLSKNDIDQNESNYLVQELNAHCLKLFNLNKQEIAKIVLNHYHELDSNKFEVSYHKEFPIESLDENIQIGTNEINANHEGEYNENDGDDMNEENDDEGNNAEYMNEEEEKAALNHHRMQFKKAISIITKEQKRNRKNMDYNQMVFVLKSHNINHNVIDDVSNFIQQSGIFETANSDEIDGSDNVDIEKQKIQMIPMNDSSTNTESDIGLQ